jgi:hypothetical protein
VINGIDRLDPNQLELSSAVPSIATNVSNKHRPHPKSQAMAGTGSHSHVPNQSQGKHTGSCTASSFHARDLLGTEVRRATTPCATGSSLRLGLRPVGAYLACWLGLCRATKANGPKDLLEYLETTLRGLALLLSTTSSAAHG